LKIGDRDIERWEWKPWLWVFFYSIVIFATVPVARGIQRFIYSTLGKEFFTYVILFIIFMALVILLYLFIFRLGIRKISQYIWLFICAGLYAYYTIKLKKHPEEAFHFLEYGLLSYLFFIALSRRVRDWTIYITSILSVLFVGTLDEFLQWMIPERFWGFRDIGLNTLAGVIFMLGVWKGIKPELISMPVKRLSVKVLVWVITANLIFLGLCLSNTPNSVNFYTERLNLLSWLRNEEPMVEYGYKHRDPEIGVFYSRLRLKELRDIDIRYGSSYGKDISKALVDITYEGLIKSYSPFTNPFLHEFILHLQRRDSGLEEFNQSTNSYMAIRSSNTALKENLILERYFSNTLRHSGYILPDEILKRLKDSTSSNNEFYISRIDNLITAFDLKMVWSAILITLITVWRTGRFWKRYLER